MVRLAAASPGDPGPAANPPFSMWSTMDLGRLSSPAEVWYLTLSPSSTALSAVIRRPFLRTIVSGLTCAPDNRSAAPNRSEEHTSELQSRLHLVCRLLLT